jgi:hypothetical protein
MDGDVRYVRDPELVRAVNRKVLGPIGPDRLGVVAVGRRDIAAPSTGLEIVLAHQPSDLLVIDDHAPMLKLGANAPPAIEFELLADRGDRLDDRGAVPHGGFVVEGRAASSAPASRL